MPGLSEEELFRAHRNMPKQRQIRLVREPAEAVAIAKCLIHRLVGERKGDNKFLPWEMHPWECRYCKVPTDLLTQAHEEWLVWSGEGPKAFFPNIPDDFIQPGAVKAFASLPPDHAARLVWEYQGYEVNEYGKPEPRRTKKGERSATGTARRNTRPNEDPASELPEDDIRASSPASVEDHPEPAPGGDADGPPSDLWSQRNEPYWNTD
jgi:hypothetical protein